MTRPGWTKYAVGEPSTRRNWTNPDCSPFDTVYHICHVKDAFRYLEDGNIKSSLVWDESRLKNTRTVVSWLSPNLWAYGSLYGNIRFDFDWRQLVKGRKFYWVEVMTSYRPPAYRILLAKDEPSVELEEYPYEDGVGPLFYDEGGSEWYCNGKYTGESMVDSDLPLSKCKGIGFELHHNSYCRKDHSRCNDLGRRGVDAGAKLIARLIAQKTLQNDTSLRDLFLDEETFNIDVDDAWKEILRSFSRAKTGGDVKHSDPAARPIALAMLDRFAAGRSRKELALCSVPTMNWN
jgi:hypothetical protein